MIDAEFCQGRQSSSSSFWHEYKVINIEMKLDEKFFDATLFYENKLTCTIHYREKATLLHVSLQILYVS